MEDFYGFLNGVKVGDKIRIRFTEDEDLDEWLDEQQTDIVEIEYIDYESWTIGIKGCDYAISTYTLTSFEKVKE